MSQPPIGRRQNFRPRPLDAYKQLPLFREASVFEAILEEEQEEVSASQSSTSSSTPTEVAASSVPGTLVSFI